MAQARPIEEQRSRLSRERVLRAAMAMGDASGIEAVTMRRLAQELGVEAMSLYHHVANKDDILAGIVDMVIEEFDLPRPGEQWKDAIRRTAISAYDAMLRHPWSPALILSGPGISPARLAYMNAVLGALRGAGFSADMTDHAYHALDSHIMGFTLWRAGIMATTTGEDVGTLAADLLATLSADEMPYLIEHIEQHLKPPDPDAVREFEFGLGLILDGLERLL